MKPAKDQNREALIQAYNRAGVDFLASKIACVFSHIDSEEKRVRHNDMVKEITILVGENSVGFLKEFARMVTTGKGKLLHRAAELILRFSKKG